MGNGRQEAVCTGYSRIYITRISSPALSLRSVDERECSNALRLRKIDITGVTISLTGG